MRLIVPVAWGLLFASAVLFYFGITEPILSINVNYLEAIRAVGGGVLASMSDDSIMQMLSMLGIKGSSMHSSTTQSVVSGVRDLFEADNYTPALIILVFSITVPIVKFFTLLYALSRPAGRKVVAILNDIHRWTLVDVLVVAVIVFSLSEIAFIATSIRIGLYLFLGYYVTSWIALELFRWSHRLEVAG